MSESALPHSLNLSIPLQWVGPLEWYSGQSAVREHTMVPLATYESPLWPSCARGARVAQHIGGIRVHEQGQAGMTRSVVLVALNAGAALSGLAKIKAFLPEWKESVERSSRFVRFLDLHAEVVGNRLFLRLKFATGDAAGHNMVTKAAEFFLESISTMAPELAYESISGNFCVDKKVSAVNGLLGRGRALIAEGLISGDICRRLLKTTPEKIARLNQSKNWMGSTLAGSIRSANAHYANMLLAFYLATGQDAANVVEGSQGFTVAEVQNENLYFAVNLPNLIVGSVGNGKGLPQIEQHLEALGCLETRPLAANAQRLAEIAAGIVWAGELSLLAAQTNPRELMRSHLLLERGHAG